MSFLERIHTANAHDCVGLRPFFVAGVRVGCVNDGFASTLARWPKVFEVGARRVRLASALNKPEVPLAARSESVHEVTEALAREGIIDGWRDELYPVSRGWSEPPLLLMERAAIPFFGVAAYGVHMNGFVRNGRQIKLWVARRSYTKPTGAGKLDQLVAGGQPHGIGLRENLIKECWEEASIPATLAAQVRAAGTISYALRTPLTFRPDVIYNFDLELPPAFEPVNTDGEVEAFYLWDLDRVTEIVRDTEEFKFNCALVVIDFLVRHGYIEADHPQYQEIVQGLHAVATPPPTWQQP